MEQDKKQHTEVSIKNPEIISFFEKDAGFVFVFKKTEKLASAVYMVTGLFPDSEPMKWTLRKKVSELVSFTLGYKDVSEEAVPDFIYNIKTRVLELVSFLDICLRGSLISHMNASVLKQEFSNLIDVFNSFQVAPKESSHETIPKTFFDVDPSDTALKDKYLKHGQSEKVSISHTKMSDTHIKDINPLQAKSEFKRSNRQNIILSMLKKKKELTIKDIALVIKDCSEKTIQRELISFIEAGVLKRTGERRWSKYSLVE